MGKSCRSSKSRVNVTTCGCPPNGASRVCVYFSSGTGISFLLHCIKRYQHMIAVGAYDSDHDWSASMVNLLPALLIGGPPNAGESVLIYGLTETLHERGLRPHAIRACADC